MSKCNVYAVVFSVKKLKVKVKWFVWFAKKFLIFGKVFINKYKTRIFFLKLWDTPHPPPTTTSTTTSWHDYNLFKFFRKFAENLSCYNFLAVFKKKKKKRKKRKIHRNIDSTIKGEVDVSSKIEKFLRLKGAEGN